MIAMIKDSLKLDSNTSFIRVANLITLAAILGPFLIANLTNIVTAVIKLQPVTFIDVPTAAAGIVIGVITMKAVQSFAEK